MPLYDRNPDVVLREENEDGALLFNPDTNQIKVVNSTGLHIWQLCDGHRDVPAIVEEIQQVFDGVPPETNLNDDVEQFLDVLLKVGLIGTVVEH